MNEYNFFLIFIFYVFFIKPIHKLSHPSIPIQFQSNLNQFQVLKHFHKPREHGVGKRKNKTVVEMAISMCMLKGHNVAHEFWGEDVQTTIFYPKEI